MSNESNVTDNENSGNTGTEKPWGGRFTEPTDAFVEQFTASVDFDQRLYYHDILGSIAHATMLAS
ncbi:MAG: argininosuccinate lyase, partial [Oleiphilaceae bacterium]